MTTKYEDPFKKFTQLQKATKKKLFRKVNYNSAIHEYKVIAQKWEDSLQPEFSAMCHIEIAALYKLLSKGANERIYLLKVEDCYWRSLLTFNEMGHKVFSPHFLNWYHAKVCVIKRFKQYHLNYKSYLYAMQFGFQLIQIGHLDTGKHWLIKVEEKLSGIPIMWFRVIWKIIECHFYDRHYVAVWDYICKMKLVAEKAKKNLDNDFVLRRIIRDCIAIQKFLKRKISVGVDKVDNYPGVKSKEIDVLLEKISKNDSDTRNYFEEHVKEEYMHSKVVLLFCYRFIESFILQIEPETDFRLLSLHKLLPAGEYIQISRALEDLKHAKDLLEIGFREDGISIHNNALVVLDTFSQYDVVMDLRNTFVRQSL
uniref:Ras-GEF domain-containing protein n=1 Tax=Rhabditophanes sp. KR3021 TaxID=114890 RepID=A0AC35TX10_9BILA